MIRKNARVWYRIFVTFFILNWVLLFVLFKAVDTSNEQNAVLFFIASSFIGGMSYLVTSYKVGRRWVVGGPQEALRALVLSIIVSLNMVVL